MTTYYVSAKFDNEDDAKALMELIGELGIDCSLRITQLARPHWDLGDTRQARVLLASMDPARTYTIEDVAILLNEHHYKASNAAPLLGQLVRAGRIERVDHGFYRKKEAGMK